MLILKFNIRNFMLNVGYLQFCVHVNWIHELCQVVIPKYGVSGVYLTMCTPERAGDKFRKACPVLFNAFPS
jgi:hypothetical protein